MTDKEIVDRAKDAEKRTGFGKLVHSPISKGVNSAYGIGFIEGMVEYRNSLQEEPVSERFTFKAIPRLLDMIEPTDRAKAYITKLADILEVEGYSTDAKIVRECLKIMNGEKVPMATMDEEPVSEELKVELEKYIKDHFTIDTEQLDRFSIEEKDYMYSMDKSDMLALVEHFTNWQKEQFEKNRLHHCNELAEEQAQIESSFVVQHFKKYNRTPTFIDAIEYGVRLQREDMMKDAVDAVVHIDACNYPYIPQLELYDYDKDIPLAEEGDKYKVVLIKE